MEEKERIELKEHEEYEKYEKCKRALLEAARKVREGYRDIISALLFVSEFLKGEYEELVKMKEEVNYYLRKFEKEDEEIVYILIHLFIFLLKSASKRGIRLHPEEMVVIVYDVLSSVRKEM